MKRRNADCGKLRRPLKRTKITENIYGSTFLYVKFLLVWGLVLLADFILEFRFEYLWPFWLLLRSVYDSFKYQGLAFSVFFVCIALTSDMICFLFIPVHWLFFAASTYVWVQYVWHTERGICLPTVSLWLLFVYIEASVRLKELKNIPFHLDLCRPFAAHCIGYPVVTLGFGFKSYIGYKMRQRKQKEVAKENEFYMQLLQQALPPEQQSIKSSPERNASSKTIDDITPEGIVHNHNQSNNLNQSNSSASASSRKSSATLSLSSANAKNCETTSAVSSSRFAEIDVRDNKRHHTLGISNNHHHHHHHSVALEKELEYMEAHSVNNSGNNHNNNNNNSSKRTNINDFDDTEDLEHDKSFKSNSVLHKGTGCGSGGGGGGNQSAGTGLSPVSSRGWGSSHQTSNHVKENNNFSSSHSGSGGSNGKKNKNTSRENTTNNLNTQKDEHVLRLEADIKRLKADLQGSRQCEQDLRMQINSFLSNERSTKNELMQLQQDNENLQSKLHGLVTARQQDKQTISSLERKLQEEKKCRAVIESQLVTERKNKKAEEAAARAVALATANARNECTENCKSRRRDLEGDMKQLHRELKSCEERLRQTEREAQSLRQYKDSHSEAEVLMSALSAMQDKNAHLENSLSAETRLKLDLFSALGEAKRQLEITQTQVLQRDKEIDELKSKIAEVMAVMPQTTFAPVSLDSGLMSPPMYSSKYMGDDKVSNSTLDPNALVYTPKSINSNGIGISVGTADM